LYPKVILNSVILLLKIEKCKLLSNSQKDGFGVLTNLVDENLSSRNC